MSPAEQTNFFRLAMAEFEAVGRLARYLAPRAQDADDLVQDTFLRAFRSAASFEPRPGSSGIRPWLYRILNNVVKDRLSAEQRRSQLAEELRCQLATQFSSEPETADSFEESSIISLSELNWDCIDERLKAAIGDLPLTLRTPFLLYAAGLHYREIAQVIESPMGTVMSRLYRARQLLSKRLVSLAADRGLPRQRTTHGANGYASDERVTTAAAS